MFELFANVVVFKIKNSGRSRKLSTRSIICQCQNTILSHLKKSKFWCCSLVYIDVVVVFFLFCLLWCVCVGSGTFFQGGTPTNYIKADRDPPWYPIGPKSGFVLLFGPIFGALLAPSGHPVRTVLGQMPLPRRPACFSCFCVV